MYSVEADGNALIKALLPTVNAALEELWNGGKGTCFLAYTGRNISKKLIFHIRAFGLAIASIC